MNGNCLRVSSYFGRNRIFAVNILCVVDPSIIVTNVLELLLCVLLHCVDAGVAVTQSLYRCCERVKLLPLLLHSYYYYHRSDSFIFFGQSEYIMLYNIIYELHRINLCHLHHLDFTVYTHTPMHTLQCIRKRTLLYRILFFCCYFSLVLQFFPHFSNVALFAI